MCKAVSPFRSLQRWRGVRAKPSPFLPSSLPCSILPIGINIHPNSTITPLPSLHAPYTHRRPRYLIAPPTADHCQQGERFKFDHMATDRHGKKRMKDEKLEQPAKGAVVAKPSPSEPSKRRKASKKRQADHALGGSSVDVEVVPLQDEIVEESWSGGGEASGVRRPPGLFEFPWQKGGRLLIPELDGSDLRDVFFSSLVDGCSAAIGIPGDRLTARPGLVGLPELSGLWPTDAEADGADCVWSSIMRQLPLATAAGGGKACNA